MCERCLFDVALEESVSDIFDSPLGGNAGLDAMGTLGSYTLVEELGRGGMGLIFRAVHQTTGDVVALKTVLPQYRNCPETLARFKREAEASASLDHPHAMPIYEVGCGLNGVPFYCMKLALGGSLVQLRRKYQGRWRQIAELLIKLAGAVQHAHDRAILHRDLKPGNILFTEDQEPMVTDFGLAKNLTISDDLTQTSSILGTPNYVAPEQAAGRTKDVTTAADVYSLGAIFFELLTGRTPFIGENPLDVLQQAVKSTPARPRRLVRSIPKVLETVCLRCLERRPEARYHSAQALADDLRCWLQGRKISNRPAHTQLRVLIKRLRLDWAWCGGVIGLTAVLLTGWIMTHRTKRALSDVPTIAVAIEDLGQDPFLKFIAQEATNQLRSELSKAQLFQLRGQGRSGWESDTKAFNPIAYGRTCNAQVVLTGCVRRTIKDVRLVTRLLRCDNQEVLWCHIDSLPADHAVATLRDITKLIPADLEEKLNTYRKTLLSGSSYTPTPGAQAYYSRALELAARTKPEDLETALALLRLAVESDPHFVQARATLAFGLWSQADHYGKAENLPLAMTTAREALALDPYSAQAHRAIASCLAKLSRNDEALEEFWKAVELNPQSAGCCQSIGLCLREMGHLHQSIHWLKRAIQLDSARGLLDGNLAESLALSGFDQAAAEAMSQAFALDANDPDIQMAASALQAWKGNFEEAQKMSAQVRQHFPERRFVLDLGAWLDLCSGKNSEAALTFEQLRAENSYQQNWEFYGAINPSSALAYLAKKAGSSDQERLLADEALKIDRGLLVKYPRNARILHDVAATYAVIDEFDQAVQYLQESMAAGWAEQRSTKIDPRFSALSGSKQFSKIITNTLPDTL